MYNVYVFTKYSSQYIARYCILRDNRFFFFLQFITYHSLKPIYLTNNLYSLMLSLDFLDLKIILYLRDVPKIPESNARISLSSYQAVILSDFFRI